MHRFAVALLQMSAYGSNQQANLAKGEDFCRYAKRMGADLALFPEMWNIGYTPIEEMISKVKGAMRSAAGRTKEAVYAAFGSALHDVTLDNIAGWFQDRAAYAMQL
jgi:predicted amidohydrolase